MAATVAQIALLLLVNVLPWVSCVFSKRLRRHFARSLWWAPIKTEEDFERNETLVMSLGSLSGLMFNAVTLCLIVVILVRR